MTLLNPSWIVGFVDGDGHFGFSKHKNLFYFVVSQDKRSVDVLYSIKTFFQCGSVHKAGKNMREYKVTVNKSLLTIIIPFFQKNPLQTSKKNVFANWLNQFESYLGLTIPPLTGFIDFDHWFIGFIDAEGSFICSIINNTIRPQFILGLSAVDMPVLDHICETLGYGVRYKRKNGVEWFQLSSNKTMCHFARRFVLTQGFKDRLKTNKRIRARKWCKIVFLMEQKQHKNDLGFKKVQSLYNPF